MNTSLVNDPKNFVEKIKPLVILYCEIFWQTDPTTNHPPLNPERIAELKVKALDAGMSEDEWNDLVDEFRKEGGIAMKTRSFLKWVKSEPDASGNVYHKKDNILAKIIEILELHMRKE